MTARLANPQASSSPTLPSNAKFVDGPRRRAANDDFKSHRQVTEGNLGTTTGPLVFVERLAAQDELERQSRIIAGKLEAAGWDPYRQDSAGEVVMVGLLSGAIVHGDRYRNSNLIPVVAKRNRAAILAAFAYWHQNTKGARDYCRYAVVSSGPRCSLDELPHRYDLFNARIGRFVERAEQRFGIVVQLVTLEQTFLREPQGITSNLHVNFVYWPKQRLGDEQWNEFLNWTRQTFKVKQFEDAGRLRKPEEAIKYALKPGEVLQLDATETRQVAEFLHRKQLVRSYNEFGAFLRDLKDSKHKVRYDAKAGRMVRMQMRTHEEELAGDVARSERALETASPKDARREPAENQILFQTLPQSRIGLMREPFVGIRNYNPTATSAQGHKGLRILSERRRFAVAVLREKGLTAEEIRAATYRLDTCTTIPSIAACELHALPVVRREKLIRRLGLDPADPDSNNAGILSTVIATRLDRWLPKEQHAFPSIEVTLAQLPPALPPPLALALARCAEPEIPCDPDSLVEEPRSRRSRVAEKISTARHFIGACAFNGCADRNEHRRKAYQTWRESLPTSVAAIESLRASS